MLRAIRELLPSEDLIYVADTRFAPYGHRPPEYVVERSAAIAGFLASLGVKAMVVACNTATAIAVNMLRQTWDLPVVGIEPGIKPAVERTATKRIVVLATQRTIESDAVADLRDRFGGEVQIILQACPGLVEQVECGDLDSERTRGLLSKYTQALQDSAADVLVLGCTHYAFLESQLRNIVGDDVIIIEPSRAVARQLDVRLSDAGLHNDAATAGADYFYTSANDPTPVSAGISKLLDTEITAVRMDNGAKRRMP